MAKPSTLPRWADAPSDPGDIVEPSSGKKDDGWNPSEKPPAQYFNWWMNLVYQWTSFLNNIFGTITGVSTTEFKYEAAQTRTGTSAKWIGAMSACPNWSLTDLPNWKPMKPGSSPTEGVAFESYTEGLGELYFDVSAHIPQGATITALKARVEPGQARSSTERMELSYFSRNISSETNTGPSTAVEDDGTTNEQDLSITGLSILNTNTKVVAMIRSGLNAGASLDLVWGLKVEFTHPGPTY